MRKEDLTRRRMLVGTGAGILGSLATLVTVRTGLADDGPHDDDGQHDRGLQGTWAILVTQTEPVVAPPFRAFVTFAAGGGAVEVNQRNQPAGVGAWSKISERAYRYTFSRFRFDPSGGFTGWVTAHEAVMLDHERSAFDAEVRLETFDPQGHLRLLRRAAPAGGRGSSHR